MMKFVRNSPKLVRNLPKRNITLPFMDLKHTCMIPNIHLWIQNYTFSIPNLVQSWETCMYIPLHLWILTYTSCFGTCNIRNYVHFSISWVSGVLCHVTLSSRSMRVDCKEPHNLLYLAIWDAYSAKPASPEKASRDNSSILNQLSVSGASTSSPGHAASPHWQSGTAPLPQQTCKQLML